ncbi:MAG: DNA gyrase inhibitor YacG [Candidatus Binatia bacterium]
MSRKIRCPICHTIIDYPGNPHRPFCSERCKKIDLGTWAAEGYVIQGRSREVDENNVSTEGERSAEKDLLLH